MHRTALTCSSIASLTLLALSAMLAFGPLTPPSGAVTGTAKPLSEVEPRIAINATNTPGDPIGDTSPSLFKITQPGSYYLTGNITGVAGKHGIEIVASGVTVDLNGFDLVGVAGMGGFDGVSVTSAGLNNIAVVNGSVRNWGDDGVDFSTLLTASCRVAGVITSGNGGNGILAGPGSTVTSCTANANSGNGIFVSSGGTISNCSAQQNGGSGVVVNVSSTVSNCAALSNLASGFSVNNGSTIVNCAARANSVDGIVCTSACVVVGNACSTNGAGAGDGAGIHVTGTDNRIEGNNCIGADRGIDVDGQFNIILRNTCSGNTTNWDVVLNNVILVVNATTAPAVIGNSGGAAPGSTDPNANFTY